MKFKTILVLCAGALSLQACENLDSQMATSAAVDGIQAAMLTDEQLASVSNQAAEKLDRENRLAPASSPYSQRLQRLTQNIQNFNGQSLNFAVYESDSINAFAMADGTVRVYSGLMDKLNDEELLFVIGHEIGHVMLEHSKKSTRLALSTSALRKGTAAVGGTVGAIASSDIGGVAQKIVQAQYSQKEEKAADDFGAQFLEQRSLPKTSAVSALRKLGNEGGGLLASHPNPQDRADRLEQR